MCNVSILFSALYATCPYYLVLYMQSVHIIECFICKVGGMQGVPRASLGMCSGRTSASLRSFMSSRSSPSTASSSRCRPAPATWHTVSAYARAYVCGTTAPGRLTYSPDNTSSMHQAMPHLCTRIRIMPLYAKCPYYYYGGVRI